MHQTGDEQPPHHHPPDRAGDLRTIRGGPAAHVGDPLARDPLLDEEATTAQRLHDARNHDPGERVLLGEVRLILGLTAIIKLRLHRLGQRLPVAVEIDPPPSDRSEAGQPAQHPHLGPQRRSNIWILDLDRHLLPIHGTRAMDLPQ